MAEQGTEFWDCEERWMGHVGGVEDRGCGCEVIYSVHVWCCADKGKKCSLNAKGSDPRVEVKN